MKIAVTDLTRMQRGYVCVAGVNIDNGARVRPVLANGRLQDKLCARRGGPFEMATVVDLGDVRPVPEPPELEDHEFTPWHARTVQPIEATLSWEMLCHLARPSLRELFGPALRQAGRSSAVVDVGSGTASLGLLAPSGRPSLTIEDGRNGSAALRLRFSDGTMSLDVSVTDLRLWADDHATPRHDLVEDVARRLRSGVPCMLGVGLTRPWAPREDEPVHWLQANNIHLSDDPCWRLGDERPAAQLGTGVPAWASDFQRPPRAAPPDDSDLDDLPF